MSQKRKPVGAPDDWWEAWEAEAANQGVPRDVWIGQCCNANLPVKIAKTLSARAGRGRPKQPENTSEN